MGTFTPDTLARIEADRRERTRRLASQASHLITEPDAITGGYIARDPRIPGHCELVNAAGECSCNRYRVWGRCEHAAVVETRHG